MYYNICSIFSKTVNMYLLNCKLLEGKDYIFAHFKLSPWHLVTINKCLLNWILYFTLPFYLHQLRLFIKTKSSRVKENWGYQEQKILKRRNTVMKHPNKHPVLYSWGFLIPPPGHLGHHVSEHRPLPLPSLHWLFHSGSRAQHTPSHLQSKLCFFPPC